MDAAAVSRAQLVRYAQQGDLARAALAIAREEYPQLDDAAYLSELDGLAQAAIVRLPSGATAERTVGRLNAFLFHDQGFRGNESDYFDPRNSFLNEVLDRRTGIPITLSVVYMEVARRCGLQVDGVGFPGHFLCKVTLPDGELVVDPFHRGRILGLPEIRRRLAAAVGEGVKFDPRVLRAAKTREILVRMLQNLRAVYEQRDDAPRALSAVDRLLLLAPDNVRALRERAHLFERLGGTEAAAADLEKVLELTPGAQDASALRARVRRLHGTSSLLN